MRFSVHDYVDGGSKSCSLTKGHAMVSALLRDTASTRCNDSAALGGPLVHSVASSSLLPYPFSFEHCNAWALAAGVSEDIALRRFIAYCVLRCIAGCEKLNRRLILRGGCALWLRYGGQRPFSDIDFLWPELGERPDFTTSSALTDEISDTLRHALFDHFPRNSSWESFLMQQIKIEVSPVSSLLPYQRIGLGPVVPGPGRKLAIRVADLERILAEKLSGLRQHATRPRKRGKDVADIAMMMSAHRHRISYPMIKNIFASIGKEQGRQISIARGQFEGEVRGSAIATFESAVALTPAPETTFESAWALVMELVGRLEE
jgi:predicted nucleotidyltransferase component of viral defense system